MAPINALEILQKPDTGKPDKRLHADVQTYAVFVVSLRYTIPQKPLRLGR